MGKSPFEIVHGKNLLGPLDLSHLLANYSFSGDAEERAKQLKKLHEQIRTHIEKQKAKYKEKADAHKKFMEFNEGYLVWIYL